MEREVEFCDVNHPAIAFLGPVCPLCEAKPLHYSWNHRPLVTRDPAIRGYVPDLKRALAAEFSTAFIDKVFEPFEDLRKKFERMRHRTATHLDPSLRREAHDFERRLEETQREDLNTSLPRPRFEDYE